MDDGSIAIIRTINLDLEAIKLALITFHSTLQLNLVGMTDFG